LSIATNALLYYRRVAQEVLGQVCTDPEVDCYDLFAAVAGAGVTSTLINSSLPGNIYMMLMLVCYHTFS
jgi:hypothetical protein